jgi:very-short-patch-repair endonuclease
MGQCVMISESWYYIVDFAIERARLIIEIDGGAHRIENVKAGDELREIDLRNFGWEILRVDAQAALNSDYLIDAVRRRTGI